LVEASRLRVSEEVLEREWKRRSTRMEEAFRGPLAALLRIP